MAVLEIKDKPDSIVWKVDVKKPAKNTRVNVEEGCVALCAVNGTVVNEFYPHSEKLFNEGNLLLKRFGKKAEYCFYVFNNTRSVDVRWGIGKTPVTYSDKKLNGIQLGVTAYGTCKVTVFDAKALISKLPKEYSADGQIDAAEISQAIQREVIAKVVPVLADELNKIGEYPLIRLRAGLISEAITNGIHFMEYSGIRIKATVIENLDFTDQAKEIIEKFESGQIEPLNTKIVSEKAKQIRVMNEAHAAGQTQNDT